MDAIRDMGATIWNRDLGIHSGICYELCVDDVVWYL